MNIHGRGVVPRRGRAGSTLPRAARGYRMNPFLMTAALALGQPGPDTIAPPSTALDGVWKVVAMEVNGRPVTLTERDRSLAIRNNTLTLPGIAAMHGTLRMDLGPKGGLR